ncbi:unnamed protein product [Owenia fusiformis]|uniref:Amine oxidase n=1 Tax=Owenia fusiformis TaxID=6347 RepID=A0A8S4PY11_OWEFU|nr:unnamed protein product [Owenia fusiformis]
MTSNDTESKPRPKRKVDHIVWKVCTVFFCLTTISLAIFLAVIYLKDGEPVNKQRNARLEDRLPVPRTGDLKVKPTNPKYPDVLHDLTAEELRKVRDYMIWRTNLELVPFENARPNSNYIFLIELYTPEKDQVLAYLYNKKRIPRREAKVVIFHGAWFPHKVVEYRVWPTDSPANHRLIANPIYTRNPIPFNARPLDKVQLFFANKILHNATREAYQLLNESFGLAYHNCTPESQTCLKFIPAVPYYSSTGHRKVWYIAVRDVEGHYLHPIGFQILINQDNVDASQWRVDRVFYNGGYQRTIEQLMYKYKRNVIQKLKVPEPKYGANMYSTFNRRGQLMPNASKRAPQSFEFDGARYTARGQHIDYLGWSFDFRVRTTTGLQIFNLLYNNERIAYEISLQEIAVLFSGADAIHKTHNHFGSSWGIGASTFELIPGVDCPAHALFFDSIHLINSHSPSENKNCVCVFEHNNGIPLRRHYSDNQKGEFTFAGGMPDNVLIVRAVSTLNNADYIMDYIFHQDGTVEVRITPTGYLSVTHFTYDSDEYGHQIHDNVIGNLHTTLFHFKVDLDVMDENNRISTYSIRPERIHHPFVNDRRRNQKRFERVLKQNEKESVIKQGDPTSPTYILVHNPSSRSRHNHHRGYRLHVPESPIGILLNDTGVDSATSWAKYKVAVTKRKAAEDTSSSIYTQMQQHGPIVNFEQFIKDDEHIVDEDIVAWVSMGVEHIPTAENIPTKTTSGSSLSFFLKPFNFFQEDPSISSTDAINITPRARFHDVKVERYGTNTKIAYECVIPSRGPDQFNGTRWMTKAHTEYKDRPYTFDVDSRDRLSRDRYPQDRDSRDRYPQDRDSRDRYPQDRISRDRYIQDRQSRDHHSQDRRSRDRYLQDRYSRHRH